MKKEVVSKVYYLTLDGHLPQGVGTEGLTAIKENNEIIGYEEIIPISFETDILKWLEECISCVGNDKTLLYANIYQFKKIIESVCGIMEQGLNNDIAKIISANSETIKSACAIAENFSKAKEEMMIKLLKNIEKHLESENLPIGERCYEDNDYTSNNYETIHNYYKKTKRTYPSITYKYKSIDAENELWFRIEIDYNLFCGFVNAQNGANPGKTIFPDEEYTKYLKFPNGLYKDYWWIYWEYMINDDESKTPNFMNNNNVLFNLFDEEYFDYFVDKCVEQIKRIFQTMHKDNN